MSQIARRRKKGRPSKADLALRRSSPPGESGYELRRGQRRRNVRYNFDFDDYLDEEEEEEEELDDDVEEEKRRKKKLKQVLKLNQSRARADPPTRNRGRHASDYEGEEEEDEDEAEGEEEEEDDYDDASEKRQVKKRRINRHEGKEENDYDEEEKEDQADSDEDNDRERKRSASGSGTHCSRSSETTPILDNKSLELILDKLQKKDIYGVYAEPVDPEELPDYHDIIAHPMDFSTVRKKLSNGSYTTLEELESDVLLICSNAMEYNSSDTVYYKQARKIQEMGKRKFDKARIKIKRAEKELKITEEVKLGSSGKKQVRQPFNRNGLLEPVCSDFSSGANLASGGASQNKPVSTQTRGHEKNSYMDVLFEGNTSLVDNLEKAEEDLSSGKGLFGKCGRKLTVIEEDRRATYGNSDPQADRSESIFTTFESEIKQFVAVGLHAEHAYGRSLARFAATLGPIAWKIASQRIEQALPADFKFGRGWVGEYEPLPTPVLLFETCTPKEPPKEGSMLLNPQSNAAAKRNEALFNTSVPAKEKQGNIPVQDGNHAFLCPTSYGAVSEGSPSLAGTQVRNLKSMSQHEYQNSSPVGFVKPQNRTPRQVELNLPPPAEQTSSGSASASENPSTGKSDTVASYRSSGDMIRNMTPTGSEHYKHQMTTNGIFPGGLSNGKVSTGVNNRIFDLSTDSANQMNRAAGNSSQQPTRQQSQSHGEQAQLMRNFSEKARTQHNANGPPDVSSPQSIRSEDSSNASVAAARAWMSIGAGGNNKQTFESASIPKSSQISVESLYNPSWEQHHQQAFRPRVPEGTQFHHQRNGYPFQTFVQQPVHEMMNRGSQPFQNNRAIVFPQTIAPTSDFTRFHVQSPRVGGITPRVQSKQRQENLNLPPDLNIGVQSPDSPAKQSSGVRVDSQQPDLALQL